MTFGLLVRAGQPIRNGTSTCACSSLTQSARGRTKTAACHCLCISTAVPVDPEPEGFVEVDENAGLPAPAPTLAPNSEPEPESEPEPISTAVPVDPEPEGFIEVEENAGFGGIETAPEAAEENIGGWGDLAAEIELISWKGVHCMGRFSSPLQPWNPSFLRGSLLFIRPTPPPSRVIHQPFPSIHFTSISTLPRCATIRPKHGGAHSW